MKTYLCALALFGLTVVPAAASVKLKKEGDRVRVEINGHAFGELYFGADVAKPFFAPLRSASGKIVTRQWPMVLDLGESNDHQHHRGLWLGYIDVNGINFWENEFSSHRPNAGRMVAWQVDVVHGNRIHCVINWLGPAGEKVLTEDRTMTFSSNGALRIIDFEATLTAAEKPAVFGDNKDGAFGIRMADKLTEKRGAGVITNANGAHGMKEAWGKPANWIDYSGTLDGEAVGIAIFDHPSSFHHPTRWHVRDYGLVAANPFADHAYDPSQPPRNYKLAAGASLHLSYRVMVHGKMDADEIQKLSERWAK